VIYSVDKLPANPDAERLSLGCVILDNGVAPQALHELSAEDYSVESNRKIFLAMRDLDGKSRAINPLTLQTRLQEKGELEAVGGPAYIASLFDGVPRFGDIREYVKLIKDAGLKRKAAYLGNWAFKSAVDGEASAEDLIAMLSAKVEELQEGQIVDDLISSEDAVSKAMTELEKRWQEGNKIIGLESGFPDLDRHLLGFRPGKYYVLAAGTNIGKTTLALNIANNFVSKPGPDGDRVGLIISLEMTTDELTIKALSTITRIDSYRIETGDLSDGEKQQVREAGERLKQLRLEYVEGFSKVTAGSIAARVMRIRRKHKRLDFLVVDYLQLLDSEDKRENEHARLTEISRTLKRICLKFNIPVIVLSQLNRKHADRKEGGKDYRLDDLRGSGSIEQDADVVLFLMPQDWNDEENPGRRLHCGKHRGGKKHFTVDMVFFGNQSRFESAARGGGDSWMSYESPNQMKTGADQPRGNGKTKRERVKEEMDDYYSFMG
jgi:replicative DNA helicase